MSQHLLLVVCLPMRDKPGHEYLVAPIAPSNFDRKAWKQAHRDELILQVAQIPPFAVGKFQNEKHLKRYLRKWKRENDTLCGIRTISLDFALPNEEEESAAKKRWTNHTFAETIHALEADIENTNHVIKQRRLQRESLKQQIHNPQLSEGVRLHLERIALKDCEMFLRDYAMNVQKLKRQLTRVRRLFAEFTKATEA